MERYYRVQAQIDLDAVEHNFKQLKNYIGDKTNIMAVIKTDAYGHGAIPIAKVLKDNGVDYFAVAIIEEAIALRKSGIKEPILILGFTPNNQFDKLIEYNLTQTVFKYDTAIELDKVARQYNKKIKIHLKIDTGMTRLGFLINENSIEQIEKIYNNCMLEVEGIFTHFAKADEVDKKYTYCQLKKYNEFIKSLEGKNLRIPIKHTANSAGTIEIKESQFDFVRTGIALYGMYPSDEVDKSNVNLKPALSLKSHIVYLKEVDKGISVSYGGTFTTYRKTKIATIPVGYGDGYSRLLSSKGKVVINNQYAPIIGRICMDAFMVDVTDVEGVEEGNEVWLIKNDGTIRVTAEDIARELGTINYEVVCNLGKRIPRVYYKNNEKVLEKDYFEI